MNILAFRWWKIRQLILYRNILASKCLQNVIRTLVCLTFAWLKAFDNKDLIGGDTIDAEKDDRFSLLCMYIFCIYYHAGLKKPYIFYYNCYFQLVFFMTCSKKCVMSELSQYSVSVAYNSNWFFFNLVQLIMEQLCEIIVNFGHFLLFS